MTGSCLRQKFKADRAGFRPLGPGPNAPRTTLRRPPVQVPLARLWPGRVPGAAGRVVLVETGKLRPGVQEKRTLHVDRSQPFQRPPSRWLAARCQTGEGAHRQFRRSARTF